jgi:hypothetical protein
MESRQGDANKKEGTQPVVKPAKKPRVSNKSGLGIPMGWVKPAAKPKKIVKPRAKKQTATSLPHIDRKEDKGQQAVGQPYQKPDNKAVGNAPKNKKPIISKQAQPSSPLANRLVMDSEGGSTVSNNRDLLAMLADKKQERRQVPLLRGSPKLRR